MRILVTTTAGLGHILPVRRLAEDLVERGHELRWVVGPGNVDVLVDGGFDVTTAGFSVAERHAQFARRYPNASSLPERERRAVAFSKLFGELAAPPMLEALLPLVQRWRPDLVLHDAAELAGPLVAAASDIRSVCHGFGELVPEPSVRRAGEQMAPLWEDLGLAPDPYAGCYRGLYIDIYPPSLQSSAMTHVAEVQRCRPAEGVAASGGLVYVTFGTVWNVIDPGFAPRWTRRRAWRRRCSSPWVRSETLRVSARSRAT